MIYRVTYQSMTAFYGPRFIEATDENQAKRIFAGNAFNKNEYSLIKCRPITMDEMQKELRRDE